MISYALIDKVNEENIHGCVFYREPQLSAIFFMLDVSTYLSVDVTKENSI